MTDQSEYFARVMLALPISLSTNSAGGNPAAMALIENGMDPYFYVCIGLCTDICPPDEDFIMDPLEELPDEKLDVLSSAPLPSTSGDKLYRRPYSRVGLGQKFDMYVLRRDQDTLFGCFFGTDQVSHSLSTPTLIIYHVPSRRIISRRVTKGEIRSDHASNTMEAWLKGEASPHVETFGLRGERERQTTLNLEHVS